MRADDGSPSLKSSINVTPLADVMLVLLIIFMVVTPMIHSRVEVQVPEAEHASEHPDSEDTLVLTVTRAGSLYMNQDPIAETELMGTLASTFERRSDRTLFLRASEDLDYGDVLEMMERCRRAGALKIALATRELDPEASR